MHLETALMVAFIAVAITAVSSVVDFIQTWHIRKVQNKLNEVSSQWQEGGSVGEQIIDTLLEAQEPEKPISPENPTNMQVLAVQVGQQIAHSFSMAAKGMQSGDIRLERSVERKMLEGLQTPESSALLAACDRFGIPRELASVLLGAAQRNGLLDKILKNDGQTGSQGGLQY